MEVVWQVKMPAAVMAAPGSVISAKTSMSSVTEHPFTVETVLMVNIPVSQNITGML